MTIRSPQQDPAIDAIIDARSRNIGAFRVRRLLPSRVRRLVGPFVYLDHMGPVTLAPGTGADVLPHPHIGLATVTWLFEGELVHRDSLGSQQTIRPGELNWMTAGRGIVHSERTSPQLREQGSTLHGLQIWVALPSSLEETEPAFDQYAGSLLPLIEHQGIRIRVLAGRALGAESPVKTPSPLFYLDVSMPAGSELAIPKDYEERAAYVAHGAVTCGSERAEAGRMLVFTQQASILLRAESTAHVVLFGGAAIDGPRHIFWNFVSSSKERIERAKQDWSSGSFAQIPGDADEFVPLPEWPG